MSKVVAIMSMSLTSPARQPSLATDGDPGRRRYTPALPGKQGVVLPHTFLPGIVGQHQWDS